MSGKEHARLLGLLLWIYVGLQLFVTIIASVMVFSMGGVMFSELSRMPRRANEPNPEAFVGMVFGIMIFAFILGFLLLTPKAIAAYGLRNEKSWAKIWAIVACCLAVLSFPLGTALGIYGFWFIFGDEGKKYFAKPVGFQQSPPPNNWA